MEQGLFDNGVEGDSNVCIVWLLKHLKNLKSNSI